jgi:hypothetical protein
MERIINEEPYPKLDKFVADALREGPPSRLTLQSCDFKPGQPGALSPARPS